MRALTASLAKKEDSDAQPRSQGDGEALWASLGRRQIDISHGAALDIVAAQLGLENWNVLAAVTKNAAWPETVRFGRASPVMRVFDEAKAREFYLDFLGFMLDWEHRFGPNFPLYAQVSRAELAVHLSGHHGDASPGSTAFVTIHGIRRYQQELTNKDYAYAKPVLEELPWGLVMTVTDPFSNRIRFCEEKPEA